MADFHFLGLLIYFSGDWGPGPPSPPVDYATATIFGPTRVTLQYEYTSIPTHP